MLAAKIPARVHQLDGVERASSLPRRHRRMGRFAAEEILHGNQTAKHAVSCGVRSRKLRPDVRSQHHGYIAEQSSTHLESLVPSSSSATPGKILSVPAR